jgi:hypothetical protein
MEERGMLNARHFGFLVGHSTILQCMRLTDHVTYNFNKNTSTAAVFLDIEKCSGKTWHLGLLYTLSELKISLSLRKLVSSFFLRENS